MKQIGNLPLKIVIVVSYTYPYLGSGIGHVAIKQAENLAKLGHRVTVISSNVPKNKKKFNRSGVEHLKMPANIFLENFNVPIPLFLFNTEALRAMKNVDVIHIHDSIYPSSILAAIYGKLHKKRIILTQHVGFVEYPNQLLNIVQKIAYATIARFVFLLSDKIIYLNPTVKKLINNDKKSIYLPNGVDLELFKPVSDVEKQVIRNELNLPLAKKIILFVGRLVPKKGYDKLYEARDEKYLTLLIGGGDIPEKMQSNSDAKFIPAQPQELLSKYYKAADLFVLPSYGEGFSLSIQEALASGLPVLTSRENNFDKNMTFMKTTDLNSDAIRQNILKLLNDKEELMKLSKESREFVEKEFSWDRNVIGLLKLFRSTK